jgi:lipopolysaccharide export system protein LptA
MKKLGWLVFFLSLGLFQAAQAQDTPSKKEGSLTSSQDPISIEADQLEVFDKEKRAIYTGSVVVTQGTTVMKAQVMTVLYESNSAPGADAAAATTPTILGADDAGGTVLKRVDAQGGVTIMAQDQIATGDSGIYERATDVMTLLGNVTLTKGGNVTKGEKLVYNIGTGVAFVEAGKTGRVSSSFVSGGSTAKPKKPAQVQP